MLAPQSSCSTRRTPHMPRHHCIRFVRPSVAAREEKQRHIAAGIDYGPSHGHELRGRPAHGRRIRRRSHLGGPGGRRRTARLGRRAPVGSRALSRVRLAGRESGRCRCGDCGEHQSRPDHPHRRTAAAPGPGHRSRCGGHRCPVEATPHRACDHRVDGSRIHRLRARSGPSDTRPRPGRAPAPPCRTVVAVGGATDTDLVRRTLAAQARTSQSSALRRRNAHVRRPTQRRRNDRAVRGSCVVRAATRARWLRHCIGGRHRWSRPSPT